MSDITLTNTTSLYAKQVPVNDMNVCIGQTGNPAGWSNLPLQKCYRIPTHHPSCIMRKILPLHKPSVFPPAGRCNAMCYFPL